MNLESLSPVLSTRFLAWLAAASWLVAGLTSLIRDEPTHALDVWMLVPLFLTYLVVTGFALQYWTHLPGYSRVGCAALLITAPLVAIGQLAATFDWDSLKWLGFPVGVVAWMIASALFGIGLARGGFEPPLTGYAIALAQPAAIVTGVALSPIRELSDYGSYTGALAHGVIWLAIAWRLSRDAQTGANDPEKTGIRMRAVEEVI